MWEQALGLTHFCVISAYSVLFYLFVLLFVPFLVVCRVLGGRKDCRDPLIQALYFTDEEVKAH